jgi:hypothetical protein
MKYLFLKISICLFFIPILSFADLPGGGVRWHTAFEISNSNQFKDYSFYYTNGLAFSGDTIISGDAIPITQGQTYSFEHPGSPTVDWGISIYANDNRTGKTTKSFTVGLNSKKETIKILDIKNDSIYFEKTDSDYVGEVDSNAPIGDSSDTTKTVAPEKIVVGGISGMTYLLIGISVVALLIFGIIIFRKKK